jgi:hypothetical protein
MRVSFFGVDGTWFDPAHQVSEGFGLASIREIAAMKLVAVMTRCAKKDFYDLVAIAESGISLADMVSCGRRMYHGFGEALAHLRRGSSTSRKPRTTRIRNRSSREHGRR